MGIFADKVKLALLVNGNGVVDNFNKNSQWFFESYQKSSPQVLNINVNLILPGGFYFFDYQDDKSNWIKYAPVFVCSYKKHSNKITYFALNFNFLPVEVRVLIFDKYLVEEDFEQNRFLVVDYAGLSNVLWSLGFEYALMPFDAIRITKVHRIELNILARFFYHQHPINRYDPRKLNEIWQAKIKDRDQRHQEMMQASLDDFYNLEAEISDKFVLLRSNIKRFRTSALKWGRKK